MDENPKIHSNGAGAVDRAGRDLLSLSMMPMRQSLRFYAEIQRTALETFSRLGFGWTRPFTGAGGSSSEGAPAATPGRASAKPTTAPRSGAPSKPAAPTRPAATTKPAPAKVAAKRPSPAAPATTKRPTTTKAAATKRRVTAVPTTTTPPPTAKRPAATKPAVTKPVADKGAATGKPAAAKRPAGTKPAAAKAASSTPVRAGGQTAHQDPAPKPGPKGAGGPQSTATTKVAARSARRGSAPGGEAPKA